LVRPPAHLALLVLCAATLTAGCGSLGGDERKPELFVVRHQVTRQQVARFPADGPARVVMEWFRALGVGDDARTASLYVDSLGLTAAEIGRLRRRAADALYLVPRIGRVELQGRRAVVAASLTRRTIAPNGRRERTTLAVRFPLRRVDGRWRLADNSFLTFSAAAAREDAGGDH
jgi:hypothetical protein